MCFPYSRLITATIFITHLSIYGHLHMHWFSSFIPNTVIFINFQWLWLVKKKKKKKTHVTTSQNYKTELLLCWMINVWTNSSDKIKYSSQIIIPERGPLVLSRPARLLQRLTRCIVLPDSSSVLLCLPEQRELSRPLRFISEESHIVELFWLKASNLRTLRAMILICSLHQKK